MGEITMIKFDTLMRLEMAASSAVKTIRHIDLDQPFHVLVAELGLSLAVEAKRAWLHQISLEGLSTDDLITLKKTFAEKPGHYDYNGEMMREKLAIILKERGIELKPDEP